MAMLKTNSIQELVETAGDDPGRTHRADHVDVVDRPPGIGERDSRDCQQIIGSHVDHLCACHVLSSLCN